MLLAVDVGNTQTVLGLYDGEALVEHWRVATEAERTGDEIAALVVRLLDLRELGFEDVDGVALSSTVPLLVRSYEELADRYAHAALLVVGPGTKTGIPVLFDDPRQVGPDRIVNAVAAHDRWPQGAIVVDFGTATTFDVVTARGEYAGGVIAPGLTVSAESLYHATAKLPRVEIARPANVVGRNTVSSMQAGLVFGYAGLVDAIVDRIRGEVDFSPRVVGTGGLAPLIARETRTIDECDDMLTLQGLAIIHDRNR